MQLLALGTKAICREIVILDRDLPQRRVYVIGSIEEIEPDVAGFVDEVVVAVAGDSRRFIAALSPSSASALSLAFFHAARAWSGSSGRPRLVIASCSTAAGSFGSCCASGSAGAGFLLTDALASDFGVVFMALPSCFFGRDLHIGIELRFNLAIAMLLRQPLRDLVPECLVRHALFVDVELGGEAIDILIARERIAIFLHQIGVMLGPLMVAVQILVQFAD